MTKCSDYIKSEFPLIDDDLKQYVEGTPDTACRLKRCAT